MALGVCSIDGGVPLGSCSDGWGVALACPSPSSCRWVGVELGSSGPRGVEVVSDSPGVVGWMVGTGVCPSESPPWIFSPLSVETDCVGKRVLVDSWDATGGNPEVVNCTDCMPPSDRRIPLTQTRLPTSGKP